MRFPKDLNNCAAGIQLRPATEDDLEAIVYLWQEMMDFHIEQDAIYTLKEGAPEIYETYAAECINDDAKLTLVAEEEGEVVGYLFGEITSPPPVYPGGRWGSINEISVSEMHRKMGIGTDLLQEAERWFFKNNIRRVECRIGISNPVSQSFWKKHGYIGYMEVCTKEL
jgi:ribosomal protein S18 acetylase RimI-like enzyme